MRKGQEKKTIPAFVPSQPIHTSSSHSLKEEVSTSSASGKRVSKELPLKTSADHSREYNTMDY